MDAPLTHAWQNFLFTPSMSCQKCEVDPEGVYAAANVCKTSNWSGRHLEPRLMMLFSSLRGWSLKEGALASGALFSSNFGRE